MGFVVDQDFRDLNELQLDILIAETDRQINRQLDEILHHPDFQQLEASWVGIRRLVSAVPPDMESSDRLADVDESSHDGIIVSLWNCSKQELLSDLRDNSSHHKTELSKKVYRESYNVYGGKPFSILIGDYVFSPNNEDCFMLREISKVVSLSFTVFVAGASSSVFGLDSFRDIGRLGWEYAAEYLSDSVARQEEWSVLRSYSESKFLALTVPKILGRRPYDYRRGLGSLGATAGWRDQDSHCVTRFRETLSPDGKNNLWVNAAFEFGAVAVDCYAKTGWLADIHGIPDDGAGGGIAPVVNKDLDRFIDSGSVEVLKPLVEVSIPDHLEKELTDLGFLTLTNRHLTEMSVFCNTPSLNAPSAPEVSDQKLACMLQYTLCAARFAHAIKRLGHDKVGQLLNADGVTGELKSFLSAFHLPMRDAPKRKKAEKPLYKYALDVAPTPGQDGYFDCQIMLQMHHELDTVKIELKTQLVGKDAVSD